MAGGDGVDGWWEEEDVIELKLNGRRGGRTLVSLITIWR
jgi:hypothetical protein